MLLHCTFQQLHLFKQIKNQGKKFLIIKNIEMNELTNEPWPVQCPLLQFSSQSGRIYSTFNFRAAMNIFLTEYCTWNHKYQATRLIIMMTQRCLVTLCFEWKYWRVYRIKWISYSTSDHIAVNGDWWPTREFRGFRWQNTHTLHVTIFLHRKSQAFIQGI